MHSRGSQRCLSMMQFFVIIVSHPRFAMTLESHMYQLNNATIEEIYGTRFLIQPYYTRFHENIYHRRYTIIRFAEINASYSKRQLDSPTKILIVEYYIIQSLNLHNPTFPDNKCVFFKMQYDERIFPKVVDLGKVSRIAGIKKSLRVTA